MTSLTRVYRVCVGFDSFGLTCITHHQISSNKEQCRIKKDLHNFLSIFVVSTKIGFNQMFHIYVLCLKKKVKKRTIRSTAVQHKNGHNHIIINHHHYSSFVKHFRNEMVYIGHDIGQI